MPKLLDSPNCSISRSRKGGRATLTFTDGDCVLLDWVEVQIEQARAVMTKRRKALRQLAKSAHQLKLLWCQRGAGNPGSRTKNLI